MMTVVTCEEGMEQNSHEPHMLLRAIHDSIGAAPHPEWEAATIPMESGLS